MSESCVLLSLSKLSIKPVSFNAFNSFNSFNEYCMPSHLLTSQSSYCESTNITTCFIYNVVMCLLLCFVSDIYSIKDCEKLSKGLKN